MGDRHPVGSGGSRSYIAGDISLQEIRHGSGAVPCAVGAPPACLQDPARGGATGGEVSKSAPSGGKATREGVDQEVPIGPARVADRNLAKEVGKCSWASAQSSTLSPSQERWLAKLEAGDLSGLDVHRQQYLTLRDEVIVGNPREAAAYKECCVEAVGLGKAPDDRYLRIEKDVDFAQVGSAQGQR